MTMTTEPLLASLVERLQHCSDNTRDEYLHELAGRAATAIEALAAENGALRSALRNLELANDLACGARPRHVYDAMIAAGMTDALCELDDARRLARATLNGAPQP